MAKTLNDVLPEIMARGDAVNPVAQEAANTAPPAEETVQSDGQAAEPVQAEQPAEQPVEPAEQPVQSAEANTQQPADPRIDAILKATEAIQASQAENAQLKERIQQLEAASQQQSQAAEQQIVENVLQPPKLNREGWEYLSDAERDKRESEYANAMAEFAQSKVMGAVKPALDYVQKQSEAAEYNSARAALTSTPRFAGLMDDMDGINRVIAKTPSLQGIKNPQEQLMIAALVNKGVKTLNETKQTPKPDEIAKMAMDNPEVMRILETKRAQQVAQKNQSVPPLSANSGMSGVSAIPPDKPKSFKDSLARATKRFGG